MANTVYQETFAAGPGGWMTWLGHNRPSAAEIVEGADHTAYITTNHPDLDEYLEGKFETLQVDWQDEQIGDFHIYFDLSRPVHPEEIGLGETTTP